MADRTSTTPASASSSASDGAPPAWLGRALARLPRPVQYPLHVAWHAAMRWVDAGGPELGASIAFYTIFSLAPWLAITVAVAGLAFGPEAARGQIVEQVGGLIGNDAAKAVEAMVVSAWKQPAGIGAAVLGIGTLLVGATVVFAELRRAINAIAGVVPAASAVGAFVRVRLRAFALLLGFGFLAIASLLLSTLIAALGGYAQARWPWWTALARVIDFGVTNVLLAIAFGALLRWLPDRPPRRRALIVSAVVSALLFSLGKHLIGLYLGQAAVATSYGAAGSFVVVLMWVYYTSQLMLFGAACGYADDTLRASARAQNLPQPLPAAGPAPPT